MLNRLITKSESAAVSQQEGSTKAAALAALVLTRSLQQTQGILKALKRLKGV